MLISPFIKLTIPGGLPIYQAEVSFHQDPENHPVFILRAVPQANGKYKAVLRFFHGRGVLISETDFAPKGLTLLEAQRKAGYLLREFLEHSTEHIHQEHSDEFYEENSPPHIMPTS